MFCHYNKTIPLYELKFYQKVSFNLIKNIVHENHKSNETLSDNSGKTMLQLLYFSLYFHCNVVKLNAIL